MQRTLYRRHLYIADTILRSQLNFSPITDLLIVDRPKYWSNKTNFSILKMFLFNLFQTTIYILRKFFLYIRYFTYYPHKGIFRAIEMKQCLILQCPKTLKQVFVAKYLFWSKLSRFGMDLYVADTSLWRTLFRGPDSVRYREVSLY